jgi:hypothetical protein
MAFIAPALAAIGEGAASAAGTVGSALGSAASGIGSTLAGTAEGLGSLFGGGEAGHLAALGQAVPEGVELVGPSSTFTGPGFAGGLVQGYLGTLGGPLAEPSLGTTLGGGLGQTLATLQALHGSPGGTGARLPQLVQLGQHLAGGPATHVLPPSMLASPSGAPGQGPIMKFLGQLFAGF